MTFPPQKGTVWDIITFTVIYTCMVSHTGMKVELSVMSEGSGCSIIVGLLLQRKEDFALWKDKIECSLA